MDPCYELVSEWVDPSQWEAFAKKLMFGFKGFPEDWSLPAEIRERLVLLLQWHYFNPDIREGIADKRARSWAFMTSFLDPGFYRKFSFLRSRLEREKLEQWDRQFADFETLLYLSSMSPELQADWLSRFDGRVRYGESKRARVIKNKGLGLTSEILGVTPLMTWPEIKARYRYLLKKNHPDVGGDPAMAKAIIEAYNHLEKHQPTRRPAT